MNVPSNRLYGACIHKWASAGLPYGLPMLAIGGVFVSLLVKALMKGEFRDASENQKTMAGICACGCSVIAVVGVLLFAIWLLGGLIIGVWFELGSWSIFADLGVFKIILAPSTPITIRLTEFVSFFLNTQEVWGGTATEGVSAGLESETRRDTVGVCCVSSLAALSAFFGYKYEKDREEEQTDAEGAESQSARRIPTPLQMSADVGFRNTGVRDKSDNRGDRTIKMTTSPPVPQYQGMPPTDMGGMPMGGMPMGGMPMGGMPMGGMPMGGVPMGGIPMGVMGGMPMYR